LPSTRLSEKRRAKIIAKTNCAPRLEQNLSRPARLSVSISAWIPRRRTFTLGHTVVWRKLKHFKNGPHRHFSDRRFFRMIGDPRAVRKRGRRFRAKSERQRKKYLDRFSNFDPQKTDSLQQRVLDKLSSAEVVKLCAHYRLARMLEREDFARASKTNSRFPCTNFCTHCLLRTTQYRLSPTSNSAPRSKNSNLLVHANSAFEYGLEGEIC